MHRSITVHLPDTDRARSLRRGSLLGVLLLGLFLGITSRPAFAQLNLLVNGSFEEPRVRPIDDFTALLPSMPGWRITEGSVSLVRYSAWQPAERQERQTLLLGRAGAPGSSGGIEQSFPTKAGQYYLLSGWLAHNIDDPILRDGRAQISLNGEPLAALVHDAASAKPEDMRWKLFVYRFQARGGTTTLKVTGAGAVLDGLAVTLGGNPAAADAFFPIDLSQQINFRLFDGMLGYGNDLSDLGESLTPENPLKVLKGIPFLLDGVILVGPGQTGDLKVPKKVEGIPVGRKATRLYFLHGTHYPPARGKKIGAYVVHYADGTTATIPILSLIDLADWWAFPQTRATDAIVAWRGKNEACVHWDTAYGWTAAGTPLGIQLFLKTWVNPTPDLEIKSLDMVTGDQATGTYAAAPFLVAVTGS